MFGTFSDTSLRRYVSISLKCTVQPMHRSHELIQCVQITRKRADFYGIPWRKILASAKFRTNNHLTLIFIALQLFFPYMEPISAR